VRLARVWPRCACVLGMVEGVRCKCSTICCGGPAKARAWRCSVSRGGRARRGYGAAAVAGRPGETGPGKAGSCPRRRGALARPRASTSWRGRQQQGGGPVLGGLVRTGQGLAAGGVSARPGPRQGSGQVREAASMATARHGKRTPRAGEAGIGWHERGLARWAPARTRRRAA